MVYCSACGNQLSSQSAFCANCGQSNLANPTFAVEIKSRVTAGILAILVGGFGVHKFYLGKIGTGLLYFFFCWSGVPTVFGLIEGIIYLTQTDQAFAKAQGVRAV